MWRKVSILCYVVGAALIFYGGVQWWKAANITAPPIKQAQAQSQAVKTHDTPQQPIRLYKQIPKTGETIGVLEIPRINASLPIVQGADEDELSKGVGHVARSALPGEADRVVLAGHRDTVFRRIGEVKVGDSLLVRTSAGVFTYRVQGIRIVSKEDRTIITSSYPKAELALTTCYPFWFVGSAPKRYVILSDLVQSSVGKRG